MKKIHIIQGIWLTLFTFFVGSTLFAQNSHPEMILVEGGTFKMGHESGEEDEMPIHEIDLSSFYIGKYEITVAQYQAFCDATGKEMASSPRWGLLPNHPIVNINFPDANEYCKWISEETGDEYRLPTEAEWEYAAKGGKMSKGTADGNYYKYSGSNFIEEVAWYKADETTKAVGTGEGDTKFMPNELGIYDMSGNVWEWCSDFYNEEYYAVSPKNNPIGPNRGNYRVQRGGSWSNAPNKVRVTFRIANIPSNAGFTDGFRVVKTVK